MRGILPKIKKRCHWPVIPVLCAALLARGAAQSPVPAATALARPAESEPVPAGGPGDLYARAFLDNHLADEFAAQGNLREAIGKYRDARAGFEALQSGYPDWRADMIDFRLRWNNTALEETLARAEAAAEAIPRATPAEPFPGGDALPAPAGVEMIAPATGDPPDDAIPMALPIPLPSEGSPGRKMNVLILADSMAIGGFGEKLDALFRADPGVGNLHTFIACGVNPLSWMKRPPYANATTRCGYWAIQSVPGQDQPKVEKDVYGMTRGHRPGSHTVPKIEDLIGRYQPDVLVMQNGNNFFSSFADGKSIVENSHGPMIRKHVAPLVGWLAANASSVRKFYWVSPPEAGNVTPEIQQYVFERIAREVAPLGTMIDSRAFTNYPYRAQGADKEHFWGNECVAWGADTFAAIADDLARTGLWNSPTLTERAPRAILDQTDPAGTVPEAIIVRAKLKARTPIPPPAAFAPYGEMLVAFLYKVSAVTRGRHEDKEILVFHPAYIGHAREDLSGFRVGKTYKLGLVPFATDSVWATVGQDDAVGTPEMLPFMLATDVPRHPNLSAPDAGCCD